MSGSGRLAQTPCAFYAALLGMLGIHQRAALVQRFTIDCWCMLL